jgi:Cys-tRNA(Pro)/Cys-tRNA(Cys) deacylase
VTGRGTPATALLARLGIAHSVHVYDHDPRRGAYGLEAAGAVVAAIAVTTGQCGG